MIRFITAFKKRSVKSTERTSGSNILTEYDIYNAKKISFIALSSVLVLLMAMFALTLGPYSLSLKEVFLALIGQSNDISHTRVVWNIRMVRIISAIFGGVGLAISGMIMQNILRNPLASPSTLGVSNAASFGAAFAIVAFGSGRISSHDGSAVTFTMPYIIAISAFGFSMISTGVIILLTRYRDASPETLVLAGVAMGSLFTAGVTSLRYFAQDEVQLSAIIFWTFGDLGRTGWATAGIIAVASVICTAYFFLNRWNYNAMNGGENVARSLGINTERVRIIGLIVSSMITALIVSFVGIIGFVGLVVPHMARKVIGNDTRFLIPASCVVGALLLLVSDTVARTLISPIVLPVGILTSFLGAPMFIYLILKGRNNW